VIWITTVGDVAFAPDRQSVARLGEGARVDIEERRGDEIRYLRIAGNEAGDHLYVYDFSVDNKAQAFDTEVMDWLQSIFSDTAAQQILREKLAAQQAGAYRFSTIQSDGAYVSLAQLGEGTSEGLYLERAERLRHEVLRFEAAGQFEVRDQRLVLGVYESIQLASHAVYTDEQLQHVLQRLTQFPMQNVSLETWNAVLYAGLALQSEARRADFLLSIAGQLPIEAASLYGAAAATIRSDEHRTRALNAMEP
jgi:hypothetical protein